MCNRMATDPLVDHCVAVVQSLSHVRLFAALRTAAHHESEQTPGDGEGQRSLAVPRAGHDSVTEQESFPVLHYLPKFAQTHGH